MEVAVFRDPFLMVYVIQSRRPLNKGEIPIGQEENNLETIKTISKRTYSLNIPKEQ